MNNLLDFLHSVNIRKDDVDVYVDGTSLGIAVCYPVELTSAGLEKFKDALELPMDGCTVVGTDKDYEDLDSFESWYDSDQMDDEPYSRLALAVELLESLAGYCSSSKYEKWFEDEDAREI